MSESIIEVERRDILGSAGSRRLRKQDLIPAVLYGEKRDPVAIQVPRRLLLALFKEGGHENRIFLLRLSGTEQTRHAMIRDLQIEAATNKIVHIDFQRIDMEKKIRVKVHVELSGTAYGVKTEGGVLDFVTRELEIETMPSKIPSHLALDVSELRVGQHVEAGQIELPDGVEYVGAPDAVVVSVKHARTEAAAEAAVEAATEQAAETEPEVIARGKKEEEEES